VATILERLRGLPRQWAIAGGVGAVVLVAVLVAASSGSEQRLAITDPTSTGSTTTDGSPAPASSEDPSTTGRTTTTSTVPAPVVTYDIQTGYRIELDADAPAVEGRTVPDDPADDEPPPVTVTPPPWAATTRLTEAGQVATDVGCADDLGSEALDRFLASRVGPVLGWDYQHVYPLGDDRYLWLFQDAFLDHSGTKVTLDSARFIHNAAMLQDGSCFTLLHRGTAERPLPFEVGDGSVDIRTKWLWPMGGELVDDRLYVFWAEMVKDPYDPDPPDGLGWHPQQVFLGEYDPETLERRSWGSPRNNGVLPIYGYAVASDETHTYFFGNTFEQNLFREGGFWNGPHSATRMYLSRVPIDKFTEWPEYRTADGWSFAPEDAVPIVDRFYAENPMQPRYLDGQWVAVTAVDGYWGDDLAVDVAAEPWGPWTTVAYGPLVPRDADPKMNTYHAHLLPWRDDFGSIQITVSNNARNMRRDAWGNPHRYRPMVVYSPYAETPPTTTTTTTSTTVAPTTTRPTTTRPATTTSTTTSTSSTTSTTAPSTTTSTTTLPTSTTTPPTSTTTTSSSSTTSTTTPTSSTSSTTLPPVGGG